MSKWNKLFILKIAPDEIIDASAQTYIDYHNVPPNRCWTTSASENWRRLGNACFTSAEIGDRPDVDDKIMIVAHGAPTMIGCAPNAQPGRWDVSAVDLAAFFQSWGLKAAGLITFKCCDVGKGNYLEEFIAECRLNGFQIGWVKAYKGEAATVKSLMTSKPSEYITQKTSIGFGIEIPVPIFGTARFKIVPGTTPYNVPDSRYLFDMDDNHI